MQGGFFQEYTVSIVLGLIVSAIWAVITFIHIRQEHGRKKSTLISFTERVSSYFKDIEIHTGEKVSIIDKRIDEFRDELNMLVRKKKIGESMLNEANEIINQHIHDTRIMFLRFMFRGHKEDLDAINFIFADGRVTQVELQILLTRIDDSQNLNSKEKLAMKAKISRHCIENNRVKDDDELLRYFGIDEKYFLGDKLKVTLYLFPFVFVLSFIFLSFIGIDIQEELIEKSPLRFGAVGFVSEERFDEVTNEIEEHINLSGERKIEFMRYEYSQASDELLNAIQDGVIQGVMINPGSYVNIEDLSGGYLPKYCTLFAMHTANGKEYYQSILVATKTRFAAFCRKEGIEYGNEEYFGNTAVVEKFLKDSKTIGFTHLNSMSGCLLPRNYLMSEFSLSKSEIDQKQDYSNDHDNSVLKALNGEYDVIATFPQAIKDDERDLFVILYSSPKIPHNSYWYVNVESEYGSHLQKRFMKMGELYKRGKVKNSLKIDGWISCDLQDYEERLAPSRLIVGKKPPKMRVRVAYEFEGQDVYAEVGFDLRKQIDLYFRKSPLWEFVKEGESDSEAVDSELSIGLRDMGSENEKLVMSCYIESSHTSDDDYKFSIQFNPDKVLPTENGETSKEISRILKKLTWALAPKYYVRHSRDDIFAWVDEIPSSVRNDFCLCEGVSDSCEKVLNTADFDWEQYKIVFKDSEYYGKTLKIIPVEMR